MSVTHVIQRMLGSACCKVALLVIVHILRPLAAYLFAPTFSLGDTVQSIADASVSPHDCDRTARPHTAAPPKSATHYPIAPIVKLPDPPKQTTVITYPMTT
jgi:hypothetical protein